MKCLQCQTELPDSSRFCMTCGGTLQTEIVCKSCQHTNSTNARFCLQCGKTLFEPAPPQPSHTPTSLAAGRYTVKRFLGEGRMKKVYLAHDNLLEREVALALLKTETLGEEAKVRIKREAQLMARLGDHPNILTVYDMGESEGQFYMVLPVMFGGRLEDLIAAEPDRQLNMGRIVAITKDVCRGLNHAHSRAIIHRDLKPSNIFLNLEGSAQIGDFGLALALELSRLTDSNIIMGTASYMSPEQATGGEITAKSDFYSLGVILYEMVTGKLPFTGDDTAVIVAQHINILPVSPSRLRAETPRTLDTLILRLLEKDPQKRPKSASDMLKILESIHTTDTTQTFLSEAATAWGLPDQQVFVGRDSELKQLEEDYERAVSGRGMIIMVTGEGGIGKTLLCERLAAYVSMRGGNTLRGYCQESAIPYLALIEVMRSYVVSNSTTDLKKILGSTAADVARIVPELKNKLKIRLRSSGDPREERYRLMQAVSGFLTNISQSKPLLVIIEDLHVADRGSLEMLTHVARTIEKASLLIVGTYRDAELARNQSLTEMLAEIQRIPNYRLLKLHRLSADEVSLMLSASTGEATPDDLVATVYERTEGNPLFVNEVLHYFADNRLSKKPDEGIRGGLKVTGQMVKTMGVPEGLHGVISKRLSRLSSSCNRILSIGSVIGREFHLETLKRLAQIPDSELFFGLKEAKKAMILEEHLKVGTDVSYRFSHDFYRKTIYEEMVAPERNSIHKQVAQFLEELYTANLEEHAVELTEHFSHSSNPFDLSKAVTYGEMAAKQAQQVYAHSEAIRLLEQAMEVQEALDPADQAKRCDLLLALGDALLNEGEPRRILDVEAPKAWSLAEAMNDAGRSSRVCHLAMLALFYYGIGVAWETPEAAQWADRAQLCPANTVASVRADVATGIVKCAKGYLEEGVPFLSRAIETARGLGDNDVRWWAAAMWMSYATGCRHDEELLKMAEEFSKSSRDGVSTGVLVWTMSILIDTFLDHARRPDAEKVMYELQRLIERNPQARYKVFSLCGEALFSTLDGHLEKAVNTMNSLKEYSQQMGSTKLTERQILFLRTRALLHLGKAENALEYVNALEHLARADIPAKSLCLACCGRVSEATDLLEKDLAPRYSSQYDETNDETPVYGDTLRLETAELVGDHKAANFLLHRLSKTKSRTTGLFYATCVERHMGTAASLLGRHDEAREYYRRALETSSNMRFRPEIALSHLQIAELILVHYPEEKSQALSHLDFAITEFQEMNMQPSLERALLYKNTLKQSDSHEIER